MLTGSKKDQLETAKQLGEHLLKANGKRALLQDVTRVLQWAETPPKKQKLACEPESGTKAAETEGKAGPAIAIVAAAQLKGSSNKHPQPLLATACTEGPSSKMQELGRVLELATKGGHPALIKAAAKALATELKTAKLLPQRVEKTSQAGATAVKIPRKRVSIVNGPGFGCSRCRHAASGCLSCNPSKQR